MTLAPQPIASPQAEEPELALAGQSGRVVNVYSAIMKFCQHGDAIALNPMPSNYGRRVFVQDAAGFAAADTLTIRVD